MGREKKKEDDEEEDRNRESIALVTHAVEISQVVRDVLPQRNGEADQRAVDEVTTRKQG